MAADRHLEVLRVRPPPRDEEDDESRERIAALDERLPRPPFLGVLLGSVKAGKSTMLANLLLRFYRGVFARVIVYSPTARNDDTWWWALEDDDITIVDEHLDRLDEVFAEIVKEKAAHRETAREQWVHIFDDCLGLLRPQTSPKAFVTHFATRYRHSRNSMVVSTQLFRALPPMVRANASWYAIWGAKNGRESAKIDDEFSGMFPTVLEMLAEATAVPYRPLVLDLREVTARAGFDGPAL